jgi:two-component system, cell cycle sensor histidine kinase and response regulator CckA
MSPRRPQKASQLATALIEHSSDAIALVDEFGTVLYANPATAVMAGLAIGDIVGMNVFRWVHEDDLPTFQTNFSQGLARPGVPVQNEFRLRHSDGTWRHIESVGVNRLDDPGIRGIIINYRDVTDSKRAGEAVRLLEDQLRQAQKMDAIGRLASGVAHDFNNILTAILGSADLLSMRLTPDDPRWADADAIKRAADRGAALTKRLLSFSRPERANATVVDLVSVVGSMEPMLRRLVLDKIAIGVTASHVPIPVHADESALSQILLNLIVNARDAMPDGGTATIELGIVDLHDPITPRLGIPSGRYAGISVRDTGEGVPPEVQRHLFEPFFTTKSPEQGTGLGLSIVYGIVKGLGGAIEVQSEIGRGATFTIYLPLAEALT